MYFTLSCSKIEKRTSKTHSALSAMDIHKLKITLWMLGMYISSITECSCWRSRNLSALWTQINLEVTLAHHTYWIQKVQYCYAWQWKIIDNDRQHFDRALTFRPHRFWFLCFFWKCFWSLVHARVSSRLHDGLCRSSQSKQESLFSLVISCFDKKMRKEIAGFQMLDLLHHDVQTLLLLMLLLLMTVMMRRRRMTAAIIGSQKLNELALCCLEIYHKSRLDPPHPPRTGAGTIKKKQKSRLGSTSAHHIN